MAAAAPLPSLMEAASCSICLEYFTDPVVVDCGHTFCLSCITRCWEGLQTNFPCPQCRGISRSKTLLPIIEMANMVEIAKQLQAQNAAPEYREHGEELKLYCEDDQEPICVLCRVSPEHQQHRVLPIRRAAQEYKEKFQSYLDCLKKELADLVVLQRKEETKVTQEEAKVKSQRERINNKFEKLQQSLEQKKARHISNLEEEEKNIRETLKKLDEREGVIRGLITEVRSKCLLQDVDLLKMRKWHLAELNCVEGFCSQKLESVKGSI